MVTVRCGLHCKGVTVNLTAVSGISRLSSEDFNWLLVQMPELKAKVQRLRFREDAVRTLIGAALARFMIAREQNIRFGSISFSSSKNGKPFAQNCAIEFNISHAGEFVVCAIDSVPVGIDVEMIKPIEPTIAESFFTLSEQNYLNSQEDFTSSFFDFWTLKECYIKAIGTGLSCPLDQFSIKKNGGSISMETTANLPILNFKQFDIDPAYRCAICSSHRNFPESTETLSVEEFMVQIRNLISFS